MISIYRGDSFLFVGTLEECAAYLHVKISTVRFMCTPAYHKRDTNYSKVLCYKVAD